jgi:cellulose synthase (UDP-forming)
MSSHSSADPGPRRRSTTGVAPTTRAETRLALERERLERELSERKAPKAPKAHTTEHITAAGRPEGRTHSPVMVLLVLVATLGILLYGAFLLNPMNRGDLIPYLMVIVAEAIVVVQALLSMWTILSGGADPRDFGFHQAQDYLYDEGEIDRRGIRDQPHLWPIVIDGERKLVDVFITAYGEEISKIEATLVAAIAIKGEHRTWILDDGASDEVRDLAARHSARYVRRLTNHGAKAGNVNHALALAKGDFYAIFDADFIPKPEFLHETMPFFQDDAVAFVQTPQAYHNLVSLVSRGAGYMQAVFYKFIQPGRNRFNAAFCVGTNVIFRRAAIDDIGGMVTDSKSEDVWTSIHLHERGWKSIYIPLTLAVGDAPETIEAYSKQQLRWATGGFEILFQHFPFSPKRRLSMDQRLQYFVTATNYLTGIAPVLLLLVPPLEIYFDLRPMNLHITIIQWLLYYCGFYVMQIVLATYTLGSFRYEVLMLSTVSFPIYIKAFWNVISGKDEGWSVTGRKGKAKSPFNFIIPQVLFFVFLFFTSLIAIYRDLQNGVLTLATIWNLLNTGILLSFMVVAVREGRQLKRENAAQLAGRHDRVETITIGAAQQASPVRTQIARPVPRTSEEIAMLADDLDDTIPRSSPLFAQYLREQRRDDLDAAHLSTTGPKAADDERVAS